MEKLKFFVIPMVLGLCLTPSMVLAETKGDSLDIRLASANSSLIDSNTMSGNTVNSAVKGVTYTNVDYDPIEKNEKDDDSQAGDAIEEKLPTNVQLTGKADANSAQADTKKLDASVEESTFIERVTQQVDELPRAFDIVKPGGLTFESGIVKNMKLGFFYFGTETMTWADNRGYDENWKDGAGEMSLNTKFRDDKTSFKVSYNFFRNLKDHENDFFEKVSEVALTYQFNKNNKVQIGQGYRLPIGVEGYLSTYNTDMASRAQIGRTFGNTRSFGARYMGNYKYADWDIGLYDSTRYMRQFGKGVDFTGWINFKPLAGIGDKYGKLTLGTGLNGGRNENDYAIWGAYIGYDYKRFHNKFEYAFANGYNATNTCTKNRADGFYDTIVFDINPKLQLVGRYDVFNSNMDKKNKITTESSIGLTYKPTKQLKLLFEYTFKNTQNGTFSNIIQMQTRVLI